MELKKLTDGELRSMLTLIQLELQSRRTQKAQAIAKVLTVGDEVHVNHEKLIGQTLVVTKINPKKAVCEDKRGVSWNVPLGMIKPIITNIDVLI